MSGIGDFGSRGLSLVLILNMDSTTIELMKTLAKARYLSKRAVGISNQRYDGSECSIDNDINATAAEYFAAQQYNQPFDATVGKRGDDFLT